MIYTYINSITKMTTIYHLWYNLKMKSELKIDNEIQNINNAICENITLGLPDRGFISRNILAHIRNLVEHVCLKIYAGRDNDIENTFENIQNAKKNVFGLGKYRFLKHFYDYLRISASHYTLDKNNSERLMLKYYEYFIKIKNLLKDDYNIEILHNIEEFPLDLDSKLKEYYEKIVKKIESPIYNPPNMNSERYYIKKIKPFFVNKKIYYEITFSLATNQNNKFDKIIAFTDKEMLPNYSVKLAFRQDVIHILDKTMPLLIIDNWEVSIRPCELNNFAKIFGFNVKIQSNNLEYQNLMLFLKNTNSTLNDLINLVPAKYNTLKQSIIGKSKTTYIFNILDSCKYILDNNLPGKNLLRYLLNSLNNRIIKKQYNYNSCNKLSNLHLEFGCIPFDQMPFATSLVGHNPPIQDLLECIPINGREHEFLARIIKNNTEENCQIYTDEKDLVQFENISNLVDKYNSLLYKTHQNRRIEKYKNFYYIKGYEEDTIKIIQILKNLSTTGISNFSNSVESWLKANPQIVDCEEKRKALAQIFEKSKVALIYGAAGTGKSTMINHISMFFNDKNKLYLAKTNPAIDNLKHKITAKQSEFKTIDSFLSSKRFNTEYDILFIDECSTVSNKDMLKVLETANFKLLVLVGDIYQIESIIFGNWFTCIRDFIPKTSIFELLNPYRAKNKDLLILWEKVRNIDGSILEIITKNNYSTIIDDTLFERNSDDEIILCLNYDGLYGINNINRFLQENNPNRAIQLGVKTYKINDPILFNESERFGSVLYNNLKGKIVNINELETCIQFDIEIHKSLNAFDILGTDIKLLSASQDGTSVIQINISKYCGNEEDDDIDSDSIVPFEVAYAVSIHKAQGLEYNSVKIIVTNELEDRITHNIFYTAITRAKEKLKIYWTPETENKILTNLKLKENRRDISLLSSKYNL